MPDGRPDPKRRVIEIRIEKREADQSKNPGSVIPGNQRAKKDDEIIWFVSERDRETPPPSSPPTGQFRVLANRLRNVTLILTFKKARTPFGEKAVPFVSEKDGQIVETVRVGPPGGQAEEVHHYGVEVKENGKTIFKDVDCPEIIIQR